MAAKATRSDTFTDVERAAMKERAKELRSQSKGGAKAEADQLAKIAEMSGSDRVMAERLHELITANVPELTPKTWYGMPGWARDGKVLCFFQAAAKFGTRYATFGFNEIAALDDGTLWPTAFALTELTGANEKKLLDLVKKAVA
jgi:uncharacterized protein YdhG (YjbR/CyaY superfamily)